MTLRSSMEAMQLKCRSLWNRLEGLRGSSGAQLLEVALTLPILMALVVGATDFGAAYRLQHDLNNACREGARFASSQSAEDLNCGSCSAVPASVSAVRDVVANYLTQDKLTTCAISTTAGYSATNQTWSFSSPTPGCTNFSLTVARGYTFLNTSSNTNVLASQVTIAWPYTWTYGKVAGMLGGNKQKGGGGTSLPSTINSNASMENLL
jgi:Flp pilus assembly protein TadG